ncbi:MAG: hypothetical protein GC181_01265 [Bacteroidetes bacterium]|nr:hypothetical protein [Bacteroidota bacterium]
MSSVFSGKKKLLFASVFIVLIAFVGYWWIRHHRQVATHDLLSGINPDIPVGYISWQNLKKLSETRKQLRIEGDSSEPAMLKYFRNPVSTGIDVTVNPVIFLPDGFNYFCVAVKIFSTEKFVRKLDSIPKGIKSIQPNFTGYQFPELGFHIAFDNENAVFCSSTDTSWQTESFYFSYSNKDNPATIPEQDAMSFVRIHFPDMVYYSNPVSSGKISFNGVYNFVISDTSLAIFKEGESLATETYDGVLSYSSRCAFQNRYMKTLNELWKIDAKDSLWKHSSWLIEWFGTEGRKHEFVSYEFDDDFNRIEMRKTITEQVPSIFASIGFPDSVSCSKLKTHLIGAGVFRRDSILIGPYKYPVKWESSQLQIGRTSIKIDSEPERISINFKSLNKTFDKLQMLIPEKDTLLFRHLSLLDFRQDHTGDFRLYIASSDLSPYHVLPLIRIFLKSRMKS